MIRMRQYLLILIALMLITGTVSAGLERTFSYDDGLVYVHLNLPEGMIGGISEEIPPGFTYLGTTHPSDQVDLQGRTIHFAVIGEEGVTYTLQGAGEPAITGRILLLSGDEEIPAEASPAPILGALGAASLCLLMIWGRSR